ncbi:ATP-binding protein [Sorangium sp. So ce385]|uniref:ATP-binding protein n=1 Tax=Sorangium sp. So ce385 TaxID=3133308 RepID=UPI003F5B79C4
MTNHLQEVEDGMKSRRQQAVRWKTHGHVLATVKSIFRGWEDVVVELIKNAYDADARNIWIRCPRKDLPEADRREFEVRDDGHGMTREDVETKYCATGRDKISADGYRSPNGRTVNGRRGTGKFAALVVANEVVVETWARGEHSTFKYTEEAIREASDNDVAVDVLTEACDPSERGTRIALLGLFQNEPLPTERSIANVLLRHFGQQSDVTIHINDVPFTPQDHAQRIDEIIDEEIPGFGSVTGAIWLTHQPIKTPGIVIYHRGQTVHGPSLFGVEHKGYRGDTRTLTKKLVGRISVEPEDESTIGTGAWTLTNSYKAVEEWLGKRLEKIVEKGVEDHLQKRVDNWLRDSIAKKHYERLNDEQKAAARRILVSRAKTAGDTEVNTRAERVIARFVTRSMRVNNLAVVVQAVEEADDATVDTLASILGGDGRWTLRQVVITSTVVKERVKALDELAKVTADDSYNESAIHKILANNPWIISDDFHSFRSNRQILTTLREVFGIHATNTDATTRPDFFFVLGNMLSSADGAAVSDMRYLFVELKGPDQPLGLDQQNQATNDASKFLHYRGGGHANVWLIGTRFHPRMPCATELAVSSPVRYHYRATTYQELIELCRRRLMYLDEGMASQAEQVAKKVVELNEQEIAAMVK